MDGWKGERQIGSSLEEIDTKHVERYKFALKYVSSGSVVLDAACGIGYGSNIISKIATRVISLDVSHDGLEYALQHWGSDNIEYRIYDLEKDFDSKIEEKFDVIVSLETIEHLDVDILDTCEKFYKLLKHGGYFIVSHPHMQKVPNTDLSKEFHKRFDIDGEEVAASLEEMGFDIIEQWYQPHRLRKGRERGPPYHVIAGKKML
jgi:2-polyprenyl-3-methyl-5-hydroxy-6-metoxy-1,4-benzoquinol methylase